MLSFAVTVTAMSEILIRAKLNMPLNGLLPHDYTAVLEPHYSDCSFTGVA